VSDFPFAGGQWRLHMGLRAVKPEHWLELDKDFAAELAEKRTLLAARPKEIFAALPECEDAARELLTLLAAHLPHHHPDFYRSDGGRLVNLATGEIADLGTRALHPLDRAGRLVQEDLCLMQAGGDGYVLTGASLAAPNRWRLAEKLGRPLVGIHDVVPGYDDTLARPVARFMEELRAGRIAGRVNWGIADRPDRFQPVPLPRAEPITAADAGRRLYLRIERQTLRKLPATGAVLFTIKTKIAPLAAALQSRTDAADLAAAIRTMPQEMQRYKAIAPIAEPLLRWLDARALTA
jgi:dimethylamine monooxygenase subunit A